LSHHYARGSDGFRRPGRRRDRTTSPVQRDRRGAGGQEAGCTMQSLLTYALSGQLASWRRRRSRRHRGRASSRSAAVHTYLVAGVACMRSNRAFIAHFALAPMRPLPLQVTNPLQTFCFSRGIRVRCGQERELRDAASGPGWIQCPQKTGNATRAASRVQRRLSEALIYSPALTRP
jgi:hypothetical protein